MDKPELYLSGLLGRCLYYCCCKISEYNRYNVCLASTYMEATFDELRHL